MGRNWELAVEALYFAVVLWVWLLVNMFSNAKNWHTFWKQCTTNFGTLSENMIFGSRYFQTQCSVESIPMSYAVIQCRWNILVSFLRWVTLPRMSRKPLLTFRSLLAAERERMRLLHTACPVPHVLCEFSYCVHYFCFHLHPMVHFRIRLYRLVCPVWPASGLCRARWRIQELRSMSSLPGRIYGRASVCSTERHFQFWRKARCACLLM